MCVHSVGPGRSAFALLVTSLLVMVIVSASDAQDHLFKKRSEVIPPTERLDDEDPDESIYMPIVSITIPPFFFVSKTGNNADGRSWATAWNELDQIRWDQIAPGSVIVIRGGEYHTSMLVGASGTPSDWITITTDGNQVILDGLRPSPPYCGQEDYAFVEGSDAINLDGRENILIDGGDWRGIRIRNHARGIRLREGASNIVVRNVEIYDNGWSIGSGRNTEPDGPGVELGGTNILFEQVIIHDNGQDAFQCGWGVWNFTLRRSWLYNSREHPTENGRSFNYCSHTDGIQIYGDLVQGPLVVEDSIIGPSFTQGIIIGRDSTVDYVVINNTVFVGSTNAAINFTEGGKSSNWEIQNATIVQSATEDSWNVRMEGIGHVIRDSIFWGGPWGIGIFEWAEVSGNYHWLTPDRYSVATEMDPLFADPEFSRFGQNPADFDFTPQNPIMPPGTGSSVTSLDRLFGQLPVVDIAPANDGPSHTRLSRRR